MAGISVIDLVSILSIMEINYGRKSRYLFNKNQYFFMNI